MGKPVWITPVGDLGTIPENVFYRVPLVAIDPAGSTVKFRLLAGKLPDGMQMRQTGVIEGIPQPVIDIQGVPTEVNRDVTSQFAIRAYTEEIINGVSTVRISDRTFSITVSGQDIPTFITPPGELGRFLDGIPATIPIEYTDTDPGDRIRFSILSGTLPPGLAINPATGVISGIIYPLVGPPGSAPTGYDRTEFSEYPFDFSTRAADANFEFTVEISDGKDSNVRAFSIYVYARNNMTADNTSIDADNTDITADITPYRSPILLTPAGSLGTVRADNFYAFQFKAIDFDGDQIKFILRSDLNSTESVYTLSGNAHNTFGKPPGLTLNEDTGWFFGYIPDQGAVDITYQFGVSVCKKNDESIVSPESLFTLTIAGNLDAQVSWLTPADLGTINNGSISTLSVEAYNAGGRALTYKMAPGYPNKLPQGLQLQPLGHITGRVSFNTFALDGGTTTFDRNNNRTTETTVDSEFQFTVNAYAPVTEQLGYQIESIVITNQGSGYTSQPIITISEPFLTTDSIQATAGVATIVNGKITDIDVGNPGRGYMGLPTVTITGGGGIGAIATVTLSEVSLVNAVSVYRTFTVRVNRAFNEPYQSLYIKAMPPASDRTLIANLVQNQDIIPSALVYRADDPNFGVAKSVVYMHAYGLQAASLESYFESLTLNHYLKNITLGEIKTAQAVDASGQIIYEVVYSEVIDNLVNNRGQSVGKSVNLAYTAYTPEDVPVATVYPNSLINMRNQVIASVGQVTPGLPLWMTSKQKNGRVLGFVPAWVIAYVKPTESERVAYNIKTKFEQSLNVVDFEVDRYELDCSQTKNWDPEGHWVPSPAEATTFDETQTVFDGSATDFIAPADQWEPTDKYDKYLIFPQRTILG